MGSNRTEDKNVSSWGSLELLLKLEADINDSHRRSTAQSTRSHSRRSLQTLDMEETGQEQLNGGKQAMSPNEAHAVALPTWWETLGWTYP